MELRERALTPLSQASDSDLLLEIDYRKFQSKIRVEPSGCWSWMGTVDKRDGYSHMYRQSLKKTVKAYRFSYEYHHGLIPIGAVIDHICKNRICVNPDHLRAISNTENVMLGDGVTAQNASKQFCANGHEFSGNNLYIRPDGGRDCRACHLAASRRHRAKKAMLTAFRRAHHLSDVIREGAALYDLPAKP